MRTTALDIIAIVQRAIEAAGVDLNPVPESEIDDQQENQQADDAAERGIAPTGRVVPTRVTAEGADCEDH